MEILYKSTRSNMEPISASKAILKGLADDGGLFIPTSIPKLDISASELKDLNYKEIAFLVMRKWLTDFTDEQLTYCIDRAYDKKFDTEKIAPIKKAGDEYYLELFHGKTIAFKDMALSILPYLMKASAEKNNTNDKIVILTATSGDTGKAALAGFENVDGIEIIVFYPKGGVSKIQELQMLTTSGKNTHVISVDGNFDDCQNGVKNIFENNELKNLMRKKGLVFSSANSINIGRLIPQIVYYVYSYATLLKDGQIKENEKINFCVPTGNFGNILAGYYAKSMGLPINKLVCASNTNKVLYDFFNTGIYDKNRDFVLTSSPSMDILISSNLERFIYELVENNADKNSDLMSELKTKGVYVLSKEQCKKLSAFEKGYADEKNTSQFIKEMYEKYNYIIDPHTAVAGYVYKKYKENTSDNTKAVIVSTASPYKFAPSVMASIDNKYIGKDVFELIEELRKLSNIEKPRAILEIEDAKIMHNKSCKKEELKEIVCDILDIRR